mmetsp:Transcript_101977/g.243119  ORF Transcript_101977/g.243119 Transcript_101977/m.243119 type:complete len:326 (-) Transcript_101977:676-1653(-)
MSLQPLAQASQPPQPEGERQRLSAHREFHHPLPLQKHPSCRHSQSGGRLFWSSAPGKLSCTHEMRQSRLVSSPLHPAHSRGSRILQQAKKPRLVCHALWPHEAHCCPDHLCRMQPCREGCPEARFSERLCHPARRAHRACPSASAAQVEAFPRRFERSSRLLHLQQQLVPLSRCQFWRHPMPPARHVSRHCWPCQRGAHHDDPCCVGRCRVSAAAERQPDALESRRGAGQCAHHCLVRLDHCRLEPSSPIETGPPPSVLGQRLQTMACCLDHPSPLGRQTSPIASGWPPSRHQKHTPKAHRPVATAPWILSSPSALFQPSALHSP